MERGHWGLAVVVAAVGLTVLTPAAAAAAGPVGGASVSGEVTEVAGSIAVIGGTTTAHSLHGYHAIRGDELWSADEEYLTGGTIVAWAEDPAHFAGFDAALVEHGEPAAVWWQLTGFNADLEEWDRKALTRVARDVLEQIRARVGPDLPIYASPMTPYTFNTRCFRIAGRSVFKTYAVVDRLLELGLVEPGPRFAELSPYQVRLPSCMHKPDGRRQDGAALVDFFGR